MRTIALALALIGLAAAASAADYKLKKTAKAQKELVVHGHANVSSTCESREQPPEIELNIPPKGGTVCMRPGMSRVGYTWSGRNQHCIGKRLLGVFVVYIPFRNFTGSDTILYTVTVQPSLNSRTYEVDIMVEAGQAIAPGAGSAPSEPQKAGPMPACSALVADAEITRSSHRHR